MLSENHKVSSPRKFGWQILSRDPSQIRSFAKELLVEHGQLGHAFVAPNLVAPVRMGLL